MTFWRTTGEGVMVEVKVQPKSRRPGVQGRVPALEGERLRIGVSEAAEDGRANAAACASQNIGRVSRPIRNKKGEICT